MNYKLAGNKHLAATRLLGGSRSLRSNLSATEGLIQLSDLSCGSEATET